MPSARTLLAIVQGSRVAIGASLLAAPHTSTSRWIGDAAASPGAAVAVRGLGGRDVVLGLGGLIATVSGSPYARHWHYAAAGADLADSLATAAARRSLPSPGAEVIAVGALLTVLAEIVLAARLDV